jgi:hypothetical protein
MGAPSSVEMDDSSLFPSRWQLFVRVDFSAHIIAFVSLFLCASFQAMVGFSDHEKLEALFKRVDLDGNGTLDFCEFMCLLYLWNDKVQQKWQKCVHYIISSYAPFVSVRYHNHALPHTETNVLKSDTYSRGEALRREVTRIFSCIRPMQQLSPRLSRLWRGQWYTVY